MAGPRDRLGEVLALLVFTDTFGYAIVLPLMPLAAQRHGAAADTDSGGTRACGRLRDQRGVHRTLRYERVDGAANHRRAVSTARHTYTHGRRFETQ